VVAVGDQRRAFEAASCKLPSRRRPLPRITYRFPDWTSNRAAGSGGGKDLCGVDARAVSYLAMTIWAYEELVDGVNWFRHLLGLFYILSTGVHLAAALGH